MANLMSSPEAFETFKRDMITGLDPTGKWDKEFEKLRPVEYPAILSWGLQSFNEDYFIDEEIIYQRDFIEKDSINYILGVPNSILTQPKPEDLMGYPIPPKRKGLINERRYCFFFRRV